MFRARTSVSLPLISVAALSAGLMLFVRDSSRTSFLTLFLALLLWFFGCAMLIVWSAQLTFRENGKAAIDPQRDTTSLKRAS